MVCIPRLSAAREAIARSFGARCKKREACVAENERSVQLEKPRADATFGFHVSRDAPVISTVESGT